MMTCSDVPRAEDPNEDESDDAPQAPPLPTDEPEPPPVSDPPPEPRPKGPYTVE
jgi:hypothetical protein